MTRRLLLPGALLLGLVAGCSSSIPGDSATTAPADDATPQLLVCESFYVGPGTPLADRAEDARAALSAGAVVDTTTYGEVNVLEQRITELGTGAPAELARLLEEVRAPFTEAVAAYNEATAGAGTGEEEPQLPDLTSIDTTASAAAQAELRSTCQDVGYRF